MLFDITRTVNPQTPVWPGDQSFSATPVLAIADGDSVNLTTLTLSPHTGTHMDAVFHTQRDGAHPAQMALEPYIGPARVVHVGQAAGPIAIDALPAMDWSLAPRLLLRTPVSELPPDVWPDPFPYLSVELIDWAAAQGIRLIGLDSPSVDAFDSKSLPCHQRLGHHGIVNLESLALAGVLDGVYELVALPLKLDLACGSPVRAILRA
jgi:arylformamidase